MTAGSIVTMRDRTEIEERLAGLVRFLAPLRMDFLKHASQVETAGHP